MPPIGSCSRAVISARIGGVTDSQQHVLIAGSSGNSTACLARRLGRPPMRRCRSLPLEPGWPGRVRGEFPDAVVFLTPVSERTGEPCLDLAGQFLEWCGRARPECLVVVCSTAVHAPSNHHPGMVSESFLLPRRRLANPIARAWRELEGMSRRLAGSAPSVTLLRSPPVITAAGEDFFSRLFAARLPLVLPGHDPVMQFLSGEDLAGAIDLLLQWPPPGRHVFHVAPDGVIPLKAGLRLAGRRPWPLPRTLQRPLRRFLSPLGWTNSGSHLDYLRYGWTVNAERIHREFGFRARHSSAAALRSGLGIEGPVPEQQFDEYGLSPPWIRRLGRTLFRFLGRLYFRVECQGLDEVPREGRAVLVGNHRGFFPFDAMIMLHLLAERRDRYPRFLIHPGLHKFPFLHDLFVRLGGVLACRQNAERILLQEGLLGVLPEGVKGAFTPYRSGYRLRRFSDDFVKLALRHRAPIIPFVTLGAAETFPILANAHPRWWRNWTEWPCLPLVFPLPLPAKWHFWCLPALAVHEQYPPAAALDPEVVRSISAEVRGRMEQALSSMIRRRRSIFCGSVLDGGYGGKPPE